MSVQITFEPDSGNGLVAEGTYIWEAAKRMGVSLRAECKGKGECDSCAVVIVSGGELLSEATGAEAKMLGRNRLAHPGQTERLACQARLDAQGEVTVRFVPIREEEQQKSEFANTLRGLPFKEKVGALIELEAVIITGALNSVRGSYHALVAKFLNLPLQTTKDAEETTKDAGQTTKDNPGKERETAKGQERDGGV
ncbi:MAG TPA: 2Fe-2S iron-sulfur cluster-binding protein [Pyrinomonadaceae bacterium]|nr:2Fe-2S iron-sulfur cluster-binding protein [Pyrinomonadaceae bacterium]